MPEQAKKMPNTAAAMIGVLTAIAIISGTALGVTNQLTYERIQENRRERTMQAVRRVLPEYANDPAEDVWDHPELEDHRVYPGRDADGKLVGTAVQTLVGSGYGGDISAITGLNREGQVTGVEVIQHSETPGLGARITDSQFTGQFVGLNPLENPPRVEKDGGDIDSITAATISSRATAELVEKAGQVFAEYRGGTNE